MARGLQDVPCPLLSGAVIQQNDFVGLISCLLTDAAQASLEQFTSVARRNNDGDKFSRRGVADALVFMSA